MHVSALRRNAARTEEPLSPFLPGMSARLEILRRERLESFDGLLFAEQLEDGD